MMLTSKKNIQNTIQGLFIELDKSIQALLLDQGKKQTRQVRTNIKHIKALLDFFGTIEQYEGDDITILKKLYKKIGAYRERQIIKKRLLPYKATIKKKQRKTYIQHNEEIAKKKQKNLQTFLEKHTIDTKELQHYMHDICTRHTLSTLTQTWNIYNEHATHTISHLLWQKHIHEEDMHTIRKTYKQLLYLSMTLVAYHRHLVATYDAYQKQIGKRNDHIDMRDALNIYQKQTHDTHIKKIVASLEEKTDQDMQTIIATLRAIYPKND